MGPYASAMDLLRRCSQRSDSLCCGFSGKDSLAVLHLAVTCGFFKRVEAYFMYFVPGLRCIEPYMDRTVARLGITLHKLPHFGLTRMFATGELMPRYTGADALSIAGLTEIEAVLRKRTGIDWFANGARADESVNRRQMLNANGGWWESTRRIYPIYRWSRRDVMTYLKRYRLPPPPDQGRVNLGGIGLDPPSLNWLKEHYPDDFQKVCATFPHIPAYLERLRLYGRARHRQPGQSLGYRKLAPELHADAGEAIAVDGPSCKPPQAGRSGGQEAQGEPVESGAA